MGGIAEFVHFARNNNKVHKDDLKDDGAPTLQIVHYRDKESTNILFAQYNSREEFEAGRQKSIFPSVPSYLDLAPHDDFDTPSGLVSIEYNGEEVIFTANKIGATGWLPRFTVAGRVPLRLLKEANVLAIKRGKNAYIDCVLKEGGGGKYEYQFVVTWPRIQRQETQYFPEEQQTMYFPEEQQTMYFPEAEQQEEEPLEKPLEDEKTDTTLPYTPAADKDAGDKLGSDATTPRDNGAAASGASGASVFQYKVDTDVVPHAVYMTEFKAFVSDPANAKTVAQWKSDAELHAAAAETKKVFAGKCLAFVMKQFKDAMTDAAVASAVETRMQTHNENLTKPLTKKEKKDAAEAAEDEKRKSKKAGKAPRRCFAAAAGKKPRAAGKKPEAAGKKRKAALESSYKDSSDTE